MDICLRFVFAKFFFNSRVIFEDFWVNFAFLQFPNKGGSTSILNTRYPSIFEFAFKLSILKRSIDDFDIVKSVWILLKLFDTAQIYSTL